jgi:hypothetical protein
VSNVAGSVLNGSMVFHSVGGVRIGYATTYASVGGTAMQYALEITLERIK